MKSDGLDLMECVNVRLIRTLRTFKAMTTEFDLIVNRCVLNDFAITVCNSYNKLQRPLFNLLKKYRHEDYVWFFLTLCTPDYPNLECVMRFVA